MSKEIYISSTPHETRLAIVETDELTEIYYERENEYTLAGSIYNGKVTRVLPGMQSSFVDIGLERDAFLYITDFMEEAADSADFETSDGSPQNRSRSRSRDDRAPEESRLTADSPDVPAPSSEEAPANRSERGDRSGRDRGRRSGNRDDHSGNRDDRSGNRDDRSGNRSDRSGNRDRPVPAPIAAQAPVDAGIMLTPPPTEESSDFGEGEPGADGSRRWRGRRGRRRGRGAREEQGATPGSSESTSADPSAQDPGLFELEAAPAPPVQSSPHSLSSQNLPSALPDAASLQPTSARNLPTSAIAPPPASDYPDRSARGDGDRDRSRGRGDRGGRDSGRDSDRSGDRSGRGDRGGRDRSPRAPRGFAPRTALYGVDASAEPEESSTSATEAIVLPGESLSKYRRDAEGNTVPAPASADPTPAPTQEFRLAGAWDGGNVLPGESLSRRSPASESSSSRSSRDDRPSREDRPSRDDRPSRESRGSRDRAPYRADGPARNEAPPLPPAAPDTPSAAIPSSSATSYPEPAILHDEDILSVVPRLEAPPEPVEAAAPPSPSSPSTESAEYEPTEASASLHFDPAPPSEFRQATAPDPVPLDAQPAPPTKDPEPSRHPASNQTAAAEHSIAHSITPEPGTPIAPLVSHLHPESEELPAHELTSITSQGEMHTDLPAPPQQVVADPTAPIQHETAILAAEETSSPAIEPHPFLGTSALEHEEFDEQEEFDEPDPAQQRHPSELEHARTTPTPYQLGDLHASAIEEMDDLDEETLEGAADLGTMLREMSIDEITRGSLDPNSDEDDDILEEEDSTEDAFHASGSESREESFPDHPDDAHFESTSDEASSLAFESSHDSNAPAQQDDGSFTPLDSRSASDSSPSNGDRARRDRGRDSRDGRRGDRRSSDRSRSTGGSGDRERERSSGSRPGRRDGRHTAQLTNLPAISDLLKPGQEILCQIAKEPMAKKGARITSHIALPGRFLVFMPTVNHTGVSRKIESDAERRRLKEILLSEKGEASGGFIVRTAASGASEEELRSDLRFLLNLWTDIKTRSESSKSPALIYHDLNLVERVLRDQVTDTFSAIWVDTETEYERVLRFLQRFQPSLIRRVKLYTKEVPLFEQFGITEEINKALRSKVWLKSGGSIVINQTEALVAIDINTGKFVGKTARLEDTIVKTNLDAIPEIVRQIRLRDLGGIIIIDFIDMDERKNRNKVMAALEDELKNDRAPSKVLQFNDFGLVAITRKRVKQSLERTLSTTCNICIGTGMVKSPVTVANDIYIEMRKMQKHLDRGDVMLRVHPEVVKQLKSPGSKWLQEMEEMVGKTILVKSDPSLHPEQFDIH